MRNLIFRVCAIALAASLFGLWAGVALAHAQLREADPVQNALLTAAPAEATLRFNEAVTALSLVLIAPDATRADLTADAKSGETVRIALPHALSPGTYALSWRVASVDGHPVVGTVVFSIGHTSALAATPESSDRTVWAAITLLCVVLLVGLTFGVGGAGFALYAPLPQKSRRLALVATLLALGAIPPSIGLQGLDALGLSFAALASPAPWTTAMGTTFGLMAATAAAALALALVALAVPRLRLIAVPAWVLAAVAPALSGHAGSIDPQIVMRAAVATHIAAVLFWIGALHPLHVLLRERDDASTLALRRFSTAVPYAVAALLLSGFFLAARQLGWPGPSWLSPYGAILAAKLSLVALLLSLAAWNRFRLTRPVLSGSSDANRQLRRTIRVEVVLALVVLALVSGWRFTPPPRALADAARPAAAEPVFVHTMNEELMANVTVSPGLAGPSELEISLTNASYAPVPADAVSVALSAPGLGIEPMTIDARFDGTIWRVDHLTIPVPGSWYLELTIRTGTFSQVRLGAEFDLPANRNEDKRP